MAQGLFEEEKKEYPQPRSMRQAMQQAQDKKAQGAGLPGPVTEQAAPAQQQTDPTAPAGYELGKKVGGMIGGLKDGMDARVNRQIDLVTAAPRAAALFGGNVVRGMRGDAPNTESFSLSPSSEQAATPQPTANVAAFRQTEAQNPAPGRLGAMLSARGNRQADAMLYGDGAKIVGGNSPQAASALPAPSPSVRPTTGMVPGGWMRNEQTGEVLTIGANRGSKLGMFDAQGNAVSDVSKVAGRVPVGPDGRPITTGAGLTSGGRYSFQGTQDAAQKFFGAVSPGEYSPEAVAARGMQNKQFLTRQGYEEVDPVTGMTPSQQISLPVKERVALAGARLQAKTAADSNAVAKMQAEGNLEIGRGNLAVNQAQQATQAKGAGLDIAAKQMEIDSKKTTESLLARYDDPNTSPEEKSRIERQMVLRGIYKPKQDGYEAVKVKRAAVAGSMAEPGEDVMVFDKSTGKMVLGGGAQQRIEAPPGAIERLRKVKDYDQFKAKYGYLPEGV